MPSHIDMTGIDPTDLKEPLTGWAFTDAVRQMGCPKCKAEPGKDCRTPKGRKAWPPHGERTSALHAKFGTKAWTRTGAISGADLIARIKAATEKKP